MIWSTVIETTKTPQEVSAAIAAEIREARPALWVFSEKYAGPAEGSLKEQSRIGDFTYPEQECIDRGINPSRG